jgi:UDP-N-acetyl-D-mannosaminuronic acid dehydrogenase
MHIAYCPERVLPGNVVKELVENDKVIGGVDEESAAAAAEFYRRFVKGRIHLTDCKTAEMCKLTENSSRDVQIAFANELSLICDKAGVNVWELIELANKHPRVNILQPGCGVGGHCIAVDPYFLTSDFPFESHLISKAREINNYKAFWCAEKIINAILRFEKENQKKPVVALMGLAFKPDIDDIRESPACHIVHKVLHSNEGAEILVCDPNVHVSDIQLTYFETAYERADIVAFLTAHRQFKTLPWRDDKIILDFCGIFKRN